MSVGQWVSESAGQLVITYMGQWVIKYLGQWVSGSLGQSTMCQLCVNYVATIFQICPCVSYNYLFEKHMFIRKVKYHLN